MTDPARQTLVDAIDARFKAISVSPGGYHTNLGANVFAWRSTALTEDELPGLVYRDTDESNDIAAGEWEHYLSLEIDLHVYHATDAMVELRKAIADVIAAIGSDVTFGSLAQDVTPAQKDFIRITKNDGRFASCSLTMFVTYLTGRWAT